MKRFTVLAAMVMLLMGVFAGCNQSAPGEYLVYMPDGAPALAFAKLMHDEADFGKEQLTYRITAADDTVAARVYAAKPALMVLPVNAATKVAGEGKEYKMLSVHTHGNLYIIGKGTAETLEELAAEKAELGVVNLSNVPGLTLRAILEEKDIAYTTDGTTPQNADEYIKLTGVAGTEVVARLQADTLTYILTPEPAATNAAAKVSGVSILSSLQTIYGGDYPQAVLLARSDVYQETDFIEAVLQAMEESETENWLKSHVSDAIAALDKYREEGANAPFTAANLTPAVVDNLNIRTVRAADAKESVIRYMTSVLAIQPGAGTLPQDAFFG